MHGESFPALDGLRREKVQFGFTNRLGFLLSQYGKGNIAVSEIILAQIGCSVKFEFLVYFTRQASGWLVQT